MILLQRNRNSLTISLLDFFFHLPCKGIGVGMQSAVVVECHQWQLARSTTDALAPWQRALNRGCTWMASGSWNQLRCAPPHRVTIADFTTCLTANGCHPRRITERGRRGIRALTTKGRTTDGGHCHAWNTPAGSKGQMVRLCSETNQCGLILVPSSLIFYFQWCDEFTRQPRDREC